MRGGLVVRGRLWLLLFADTGAVYWLVNDWLALLVWDLDAWTQWRSLVLCGRRWSFVVHRRRNHVIITSTKCSVVVSDPTDVSESTLDVGSVLNMLNVRRGFSGGKTEQQEAGRHSSRHARRPIQYVTITACLMPQIRQIINIRPIHTVSLSLSVWCIAIVQRVGLLTTLRFKFRLSSLYCRPSYW